MKHLCQKSCVALVVSALALAGEAIAQGPYVRPQMYNPYRRPTISPYLNLARPGNAGINYLGLVRPQIEMNAAVNQIQGDILQNQTDIAGLQQSQGTIGMPLSTTGTSITGHSFGFQNQAGYFQNWRGRGGAGLAGTGLPITGITGQTSLNPGPANIAAPPQNINPILFIGAGGGRGGGGGRRGR